MSVKVIRAGMLVSIQDEGRKGYQKYGVVAGGVMDNFSFALGNILINNPENEGALEINLIGPALEFTEDVLISLTGAHMSPSINGEPVPMWRPVVVKKGSVLEFGPLTDGCRTYMAAAGGFDVPAVMGSKSTYLKAGIGGFQGRALKEGDELGLLPPSEENKKIAAACVIENGGFSQAPWFFPQGPITEAGTETVIRAATGRQIDRFQEDCVTKFFTEPFLISPLSDRMGYRLEGKKISLKENYDMISEPVAFGSIQITTDGDPIILLADRQTAGGYPKIAQVILADIPILAQMKPGRSIRFEPVSVKEAETAYLESRDYLNKMKDATAFYAEKEGGNIKDLRPS